jgi:hypothetical protein
MMVIGKNLYSTNESFANNSLGKNICIFLSLFSKDKEMVKEIAKHIMKAGFNVYFDIDDEELQRAIPAHVDFVRGLFMEQEGNLLRKCLGANRLLAMQLCDPNFQKPQIYHESKLNLTEIAGSDSHHPEYVGRVIHGLRWRSQT